MRADIELQSLPKHVYRGDPLAGPPPADLLAILDRYRGQPDALITVLEEIQHHYGYLPESHLRHAARELGFPLAQVFGVATFYNLFQFEAPGRYQVRVCEGTACHVKHSDAILEELKGHLDVEVGATTPDRVFTLQTVACVGACSLAPVMVVNDHTHARMSPTKAWEALAHLRDEVNDGTADGAEDGGAKSGHSGQEEGR
jgi:NADH-quinone oxidoreductase subunit E